MLTTVQLAALKSDILADPLLSIQPNNDDGYFAIAVVYNRLVAPAFRVWRTNIPTTDVKKNIVWTEYISRSVGERSAFEVIIADGNVNAADANVRQGFGDIFSGPSGAETRTNLTALAKRNATRGEKLFAIGTGTDLAPATMTFEGNLSYQDVARARNS